MEDYYNLYLKCDVSLFADVCKKYRNSILENMDYVQVVI